MVLLRPSPILPDLYPKKIIGARLDSTTENGRLPRQGLATSLSRIVTIGATVFYIAKSKNRGIFLTNRRTQYYILRNIGTHA